MTFQPYLKTIRVIFSLLFFTATSLLFIDLFRLIYTGIFNVILFPQFVPSFLKLIKVDGFFDPGWIFVFLLTLFAGRIYCSFLCPLGTLQDLFIFYSKKSGIKTRFKKSGNYHFLRYGVLLATIISLALGSLVLINLLDPYSNYGRIITNLIRPYLIELNNLTVNIFKHFKIYSLYPVTSDIFNLISFIFPFAFLLILLAFSLFKGRLWCNTICPVGTLLGLVSRFSFYKIKFAVDKCTYCGSCVSACKAGCIDIKKQLVDMENCIACYNCIAKCPEKGISYKRSYLINKKSKVSEPDKSKRKLLLYMGGLSMAAFLAACKPKKTSKPTDKRLIPFERKTPVSPPGSKSIVEFVNRCTACHLCISVCPTHVLQPAMLEYGLEGILQPTMDYEKNFCNFDCTRCSEVCPTGAIQHVMLKEKHRIQVGYARFIEQNCVVVTNHKDCGACSEHCPTKSCDMVPFKEGASAKAISNMTSNSEHLKIPKIDTQTCVGCGACEYACPVIPDKAIIVEGNPIHLTAKEPKKEKIKEKVVEYGDFPF